MERDLVVWVIDRWIERKRQGKFIEHRKLETTEYGEQWDVIVVVTTLERTALLKKYRKTGVCR